MCDPDIREILSDPKLKPVLPKQNRPNPDIRYLLSCPDNSLISGLHGIKHFGEEINGCHSLNAEIF